MEVIIRATIISPGTPETLDTARYGGAGGVATVVTRSSNLPEPWANQEDTGKRTQKPAPWASEPGRQAASAGGLQRARSGLGDFECRSRWDCHYCLNLLNQANILTKTRRQEITREPESSKTH